MGYHIKFQSDKYPTRPPGEVPLSVKDPAAQDLLWEYAQRRRCVDAEFSNDLETALKSAGFVPPSERAKEEDNWLPDLGAGSYFAVRDPKIDSNRRAMFKDVLYLLSRLSPEQKRVCFEELASPRLKIPQLEHEVRNIIRDELRQVALERAGSEPKR